ncbi:GNAT family N-acetyltransferase [Bradyrhizobium tropiciagri]|uniref:GNAT family N-acetyltransferase n=1 Tax=Bradyrhizobium tropiciagri TaxID=312253 RepID=UPI001BADE614|nr:GNAT family N-acetyltransferase [Bradyrhizobium tropiciagri]MBR0874312.1 GNAT family N-acetyltransferase [Bradyrhizobium tropiciagri]
MSIEIDILNGDASWPQAKPLLEAVWRRDPAKAQPWANIEWAHADLRVLLDAPDDGGLACHVGIYFRTIIWNGHKVHVGGIGGVSTRADCRRRGYASLALDAAVHTIRANDAVKFAILFCEPHNYAFYQARGWHPFTGEVRCEQPSGPMVFEAMAPYVFDIVRAPRQGKIDLCGLPW